MASPIDHKAPMSQYFVLHPSHPQQRLLEGAAKIMRSGGLVVYPTDTTYALGCQIGDKAALDRMRRLRQLGNRHYFTLCCRDLSEISKYARVNNRNYRILKRHTPGAFTFLLPATREAPRRLVHPKRKTIGLRVPDSLIAQGLIAALGQPMMTTSMRLPGQDEPLRDADASREALEHGVDLILDGGGAGIEPTTVIDFNDDPPRIIRAGAGSASV